jgi:hypothetical protein
MRWVGLEAGVTWTEKLSFGGFRSLDRPARSDTLYWLYYPERLTVLNSLSKSKVSIKGDVSDSFVSLIGCKPVI